MIGIEKAMRKWVDIGICQFRVMKCMRFFVRPLGDGVLMPNVADKSVLNVQKPSTIDNL